MDLGEMYAGDDEFKARARRHQAHYRTEVLKVHCEHYGNRLTEQDGRRDLNYYDGLGVREAKNKRYRSYSHRRDANMLRSEHIPFNMFAPFSNEPALAAQVFSRMIGRPCGSLLGLEFEWKPKTRSSYLDDNTAFDVFALFTCQQTERLGVGVEVKYTERSYRMGAPEAKRVANKSSPYWRVTRESGAFADPGDMRLASDDLRQIWRNHLLGLSMRLRGDVDDFVSVTLYPEGNSHIAVALSAYRDLLCPHAQGGVVAYTYEDFVDGLSGIEAIMDWKRYLEQRYLVERRGK